MKTILDLLEKHVKVNVKKMAKEIISFKMDYISKNMRFLSAPYIGNINLYFTDAEKNKLLNYVFGVNEKKMRHDYKYIKTIDPSHKVGSDVLNLCLAYAAYKINTSSMPEKARVMGTEAALHILQMRSLSAIHSNSFNKFLVSEDVSKTAYNNLSNRYIIKQLGSWIAFIDYRVSSIIDEHSIHIKSLSSFTTQGPNTGVLYMITDSQGRVRSQFKQYFRVMLDIIENRSAIESDSAIIDMGSEEVMKLNDSMVQGHVDALMSRIAIADKLIERPIVKVLSQLFTRLDEDDVMVALKAIANNDTYHKAIKLTLILEYGYLMKIHGRERDNLLVYTKDIKGYILSSNDAVLTKLKERLFNMLKKELKTNNRQRLSQLRNAVLVYLFIFSYIKGR